MHPLKTASKTNAAPEKIAQIQGKESIFWQAFECKRKQILNIITDFFSKFGGRKRECMEVRRQKQWRKKPVYFCSGTSYFERSFAVETALCALPI